MPQPLQTEVTPELLRSAEVCSMVTLLSATIQRLQTFLNRFKSQVIMVQVSVT